jgi:hypothetical protein
MPNKIKPKRSYTAGAVPAPSDLETNEVAINWADGKAFTKNSAGNIVSVTLGGGGGEDALLRSFFVPPAPASLTATAGNAQASLSWTAPTVLAQTPITNYTVQFSSNSGSTWTTFTRAASTATSATVTGLTNGTSYIFRVAAVNGFGTGSYSSASGAVTPNSVPTDPNFASVTLLLPANGANASTAFTDSSSGGRAVTANGGAQISTALSKFGGASGRFQTAGDYLQLTHGTSFGTGNFTIETWLNSAWNQDDNLIFEFRPAVNFGCWVNPGGSVWTVTPATGYAQNGTIATNQWAHFALVRDSGTMRLYLDGVQTWSGSDSSVIDTSGNLFIGRAFDALRNPQFYFDDYRISTVCRYPSGTTFTPPVAAFPTS